MGQLIGRRCILYAHTFCCALLIHVAVPAVEPTTNVPPSRAFLLEFCVACHDGNEPAGGLNLETLPDDLRTATPQIAPWEKILRRIHDRQMPPAEAVRPTESQYQVFQETLTNDLDRIAATHPQPGRSETFKRLTRTEYQNAIRDLLGIEIDVSSLLPPDPSSHGFDNITVSDLNPTLLNRYIAAAQKISRLAIGRRGLSPEGETIRIRGDVTQDGSRAEGLPLGTRGGTSIRWHFPSDGEYQVQIRLMRDRNDELEGLKGKHQLDVLLDRKRIESFIIEKPSKGRDDRSVDANLIAKFYASAGEHDLGVTFVEQNTSLQETDRQPLNVHFNFYRHPRLAPAVYQVTITGPYGDSSASTLPSTISLCKPQQPAEALACAETTLSSLMRRAYRRPINQDDLQTNLEFFKAGFDETGQFEIGIERALAAILVNPNFLFRIETASINNPSIASNANPQGVYQLSNFQLASRLSFFLWSSLPDETLLACAERGELTDPARLAAQVVRMLKDPRSHALINNFANQWLHLRNLDSVTPDARLFPDFDHNLREAFQKETELLFEELVREDHSVMMLVDSSHTYLNERLAKHYQIPHVQGSHFRRVELDPSSHRGGILRHGSLLSVTSYATRTSPVLRGKWVLENLLGTIPPPPPANVSALDDNTVAAGLPIRERLAAHRADPSCASCHQLIDPVGFALENFDAVGRWREREGEQPIDANGGLPDGSAFEGVDGLEQAIAAHPDRFVRTMTEKLMIYALGRGLEPTDASAVRHIVRHSAQHEYRFSSLILGIVQSVPFQLRSETTTQAFSISSPP